MCSRSRSSVLAQPMPRVTSPQQPYTQEDYARMVAGEPLTRFEFDKDGNRIRRNDVDGQLASRGWVEVDSLSCKPEDLQHHDDAGFVDFLDQLKAIQRAKAGQGVDPRLQKLAQSDWEPSLGNSYPVV